MIARLDSEVRELELDAAQHDVRNAVSMVSDAPSHLTTNRSCKEADARTRTGDPFITSEVLYQLSYVGGAPTVAGC